MPTTSDVPDSHAVSKNATRSTSIVPQTASLSPFEVERVCRAFIQLLATPTKEKQHGLKKASAEK